MRTIGTHLHQLGTRLLSALLALALTFSLLPAFTATAFASEWTEPYLQKLVSWGVVQSDSSGNLYPDRDITRAEFVTLVNRAFGYDSMGTIPFIDVDSTDWFCDDINIGYSTGYFKGTSSTTASPRDTVTREQAAVILGRNLMLEDVPGESTDFTDSRAIDTWSRGIVRSAVSEGIVHGYEDGSFKPKQNITRGEMAVLLVNAIGTLINESGDYTLGGIYGNVTISGSGVTLRDTTIAGNLYITGGVGLGYITLENVNVLGKIVICGAGESNKGENSVILRNVTAPTLDVDSLANNLVSVRAEGDSKFDITYIRTPTYLEDATDDSHGFINIQVDGEDGTNLEAAGNLKEIITLTPESTVNVAKGSAKEVTVDETAVDSTVNVASSAVIDTLNLDTGAEVTGTGDVDELNVNAAGSIISMLPSSINIRPGLTADIAGTTMSSTLAAESSADPRLLSGYPKVTDLNPTSATAVFNTNKSGTIYWAITSITDGSVGEDALFAPTSDATILKSGTIKAAKSNTEYTAKLSGLTSDGSYYLSALLVDVRSQHSPVKVNAFTTPDDTAPGFATGYPYLSKITNTAAQVTVMPTKTCRLYYALLSEGASAPTAKDFKANAVSGNLGFGTIDMTKNVTDAFYVNSKPLEELASYDLYLWLTDIDGTKSSAVKKLSFTTVDKTPPVFLTSPMVTSVKETSVGMTATLNEAGTVYWVAVKEGDTYPKPLSGQATSPSLDSDAAKLQVANGMNALKSGKVTATANKSITITISGLSTESAYDLYYLAEDKAGNYSAAVGKLTIHTLDNTPPSITQAFTRTNDTEGKSPLADTDINITFSESVRDTATGEQLFQLYQDSVETTKTSAERESAANSLTEILRNDIQLYDASQTPAAQVAERTDNNADTIGDDWVIDYRNAVVASDDGKVVVTFQSGDDANLNLESGGKYYFQIQNISDTSDNKNIIKPNPQKLDTFTTVFAQVNLTSTDSSGTTASGQVDFDMSFKAVPVSTSSVSSNVDWDILFRTSSSVKFDLYTRTGDSQNWTKVNGNASILSTDGSVHGASYSLNFLDSTNSKINFEALKDVSEDREYGLVFTSLDGNNERATWNGKVSMQVEAVAGSNYSDLRNLAIGNITDSDLSDAVDSGVVEIGYPTSYTMKHVFTDSVAPLFQAGFPDFAPSDITAVMNVQLNRSSGTIYYVVAPVGTIRTVLSDTSSTLITAANWNSLPTTTIDGDSPVQTGEPTSLSIMTPKYSNSLVKTGNISYSGSTVPISLTDLEPETEYCAYFVLQGDSQNVYTDNPYCFRFETTEVTRPIITLDINNPSVSISVDSSSTVDYLLAVNGNEPSQLREKMSQYATDSSKFQTGGTYEDYTVLDAMSEDYRESGVLLGSVFDQYATQSAKTKFANYIRSQVPTSGSVTLKDSTTIAAGSTTAVDCSSAMSGDTWYTFLTVGKSSSGSGDAFRAIRPVFNKDQTAPVITSCTLALSNTSPITSLYDSCTGTLTVQFSENLYWREQPTGGVNQVTTPLKDTAGLTPTDDYYPAGLAFAKSNSISLTPLIEGRQPISSLTFKLDAAMPGANITAERNLCDKSGNVHSIPLALVLKYADNGDGTFTPYFTITSEWDATASK
ncbi:MAG: S-layer homology domain-containing protein [Intestinimonas sp.]|jgi:hypothetical protein|nr:S-layer homology domain-containing protein [Intestinimonas sp.]